MLHTARVNAIAESMPVSGQTTPIMVRADGARFVLIEGLHRLEAAKALGRQQSLDSWSMRGSIRHAQAEQSGHA